MSEFQKTFSKLSYRNSWSTIFTDFLDLCICCFANGRLEAEYLKIVSRYEKRDVDLFAELLAAMIVDYESHSSKEGAWCDMLGDYYMEFGSLAGKQWHGQYFTPEPVCDMMSKMIIGDENRDKLSICDPACGSGRMLVSVSRMNSSFRHKLFAVGMDLDSLVCKMAVINFVLYGIKGVIINMNSLSQEVYQGWRVFSPETGFGIVKLSKEECFPYLYTENKGISVKNISIATVESGQNVININEIGTQLKLF